MGPENSAKTMTTSNYVADRTALLIVDPYNDFMSTGGKLFNAIKETADASGMFGVQPVFCCRSPTS
jgi:hypothetical protein